MEGIEDYDPFLGSVNERLAEQVKSAANRTSRGRDKDAPATKSHSPEIILDAASQAENLRDMAGAGFLHWMMSSLCNGISPEAFKVYRDKLLADVGNPSDPIEIMLVEQLALAHFSIGRLQIKSCCAESQKLAIAYADSATRLLGEFRRCTLALEDYRAKQANRKNPPISDDVTVEKTPAARNGKPRPSANGNGSANGKNKAHDSEVTTNGEVPECIRQRMGYATNGASRQTAEIGGNGKG